MENELPVPHTSSSASVTNSTSGASSSSGCNNSSSGGSGRPPGPQISVIQQALHRQPSTAAQYLQQMYAAQQQHLMLQTAALQQQHLSSAQLQSLAAVQQVRSLAAGMRGKSHSDYMCQLCQDSGEMAQRGRR
uniref:Polyhomeotic-like protein 3 n=1 Tax=Marmota marmota marmota TaxID=9994 RepID=A0A8C5Z8C0_MARMA